MGKRKEVLLICRVIVKSLAVVIGSAGLIRWWMI